MSIKISTARGVYSIVSAAPAVRNEHAAVLTIAFERADGIERVGFKCIVANELCAAASDDELVAKLRPWLEREFEATREAALKSIRTERRLLELSFDAANRGPFV